MRTDLRTLPKVSIPSPQPSPPRGEGEMPCSQGLPGLVRFLQSPGGQLASADPAHPSALCR